MSDVKSLAAVKSGEEMLRLAGEQLRQTRIVIDRAEAVQDKVMPAVQRVEDILDSYDEVKSDIENVVANTQKSATLAEKWANAEPNSDVSAPGTRSARHHASQAANSASVVNTNVGVAIEAQRAAAESARLTALDKLSTNQDAARTAADRIQTGTDRDTASAKAAEAKGFRDEAATLSSGYAKINSPTFTGTPQGPTPPADANNQQFVTTAFVARALAAFPLLLPIIPVSPAENEVVKPNTTFSVRAQGANAADTLGYYSLYGLPQASRTLNIYQTSAPSVIYKSQSIAGAGNSITANLRNLGLSVSTDYLYEIVLTDANGNAVRSAKRAFRTPAAFTPTAGEAYEGGFMGFPNFGSGTLDHLVLAPKSTEVMRYFYSGSFGPAITIGHTMDGARGYPWFATNYGGNSQSYAAVYANNVQIGGVNGYLGASAEMHAIMSLLRPGVASAAAFKSGGSESFSGTYYLTMTQVMENTNMIFLDPTNGIEQQIAMSNSNVSVRPIKRVASGQEPYPIGTAMEGGYLAAYFTDKSSGTPTLYMLIVADKGSEANRAWSYTAGAANANSRTNGLMNTASLRNAQGTGANAGNSAVAYCDEHISGGKDDWYLPSIDEHIVIVRQHTKLPSAQRYTADSVYWTSSEQGANSNARSLTVRSDGSCDEGLNNKTSGYLCRPIRRVALTL